MHFLIKIDTLFSTILPLLRGAGELKMAIYVRCPKCKSEYTIKHKSCPRCGTPRPVRGSFRILVSHNYRSVKKLISGINLTQAKELETKLKQLVINNEYGINESKIPFSVFFEEKYLPYSREKKSYKREESLYRLWIKPVLKDKPLASISPLDIEKIKKSILEAGRSPRTAEYALSVIRHAFYKARDWGLFSGGNPVSRVKMPKKDNRRVRFLTREEAKALLDELKKRSIQVYEMAFLSLYTGMRFGEIANLTWQDIDFKNGIINIKDPKNNTTRQAYITENIREILQGRYNREKPTKTSKSVFKNSDGKNVFKIIRVFKMAVDAVGLNKDISDPRDKVVFHTLRHTFASWLAIQGTPIYTIKELLGHKSLTMTERYSHLIPDAKREAVEKLGKSQSKE